MSYELGVGLGIIGVFALPLSVVWLVWVTRDGPPWGR